MTIDLHELTREPDSYEAEYLKLGDIVMGYFCDGHVDRANFLSAVLNKDPALLIDWAHFGWRGRWLVNGKTNDTTLITRRRPLLRHVLHTWFYGHKVVKRGRPGRRGSYPVTLLMIEGSGSFTGVDLNQVWSEEKREWVSGYDIAWRMR